QNVARAFIKDLIRAVLKPSRIVQVCTHELKGEKAHTEGQSEDQQKVEDAPACVWLQALPSLAHAAPHRSNLTRQDLLLRLLRFQLALRFYLARHLPTSHENRVAPEQCREVAA